MDKKFEGQEPGSDIEVLDREEETVSNEDLKNKVADDLNLAKSKVEGAINDIKNMSGSQEQNKEKGTAVDKLKNDMFEDLISRTQAKLAEAKQGSDMESRLKDVLKSLENAKKNNGNPITIVESLRDLRGISLAEDIAKELVNEKKIKKGLGDMINGQNFRTKAMREYANRFQGADLSDEELDKLVNQGNAKQSGVGPYSI